MSLRPEPIRPVPEETARVARAAFPKGTTYTLPTMLRILAVWIRGGG